MTSFVLDAYILHNFGDNWVAGRQGETREKEIKATRNNIVLGHLQTAQTTCLLLFRVGVCARSAVLFTNVPPPCWM